MDLVETPGNRTPAGGTLVQVTTRKGVRLRAARWGAPVSDASRAAFCCCRAAPEFIEKYWRGHFRVASARLHGRDVRLRRGQGGSDRLLANRRKGHVNDFRDYARAIFEAVIDQVMTDQAPRPWFSLAHSMGAAVLLHALRRDPHLVSRAVVTAPMIDIARVTAPRTGGSPVRPPQSARASAVPLRLPRGGSTAATTKPFEGNPVTLDQGGVTPAMPK
jgi:lysophospholipase